MHRLRLKFSRGEKLKFLSHLDLMRLWERVLRRAGTPPAYSEGYSPHARISMAAPLPVGIIGKNEIMDVFLSNQITTDLFVQKLATQLPDGIRVIEVTNIELEAPSLQSLLLFAEYTVEVKTEMSNEQINNNLQSLLSQEHFPWHHKRDTEEKYYDLRALIEDMWLARQDNETRIIGMKLRCDSSGSGRPEQVALALGFRDAPISIERTNLIFN
jgi:radical SAM-linked protein